MNNRHILYDRHDRILFGFHPRWRIHISTGWKRRDGDCIFITVGLSQDRVWTFYLLSWDLRQTSIIGVSHSLPTRVELEEMSVLAFALQCNVFLAPESFKDVALCHCFSGVLKND